MYDLAIADYSKVILVQPSTHIHYNRGLAYESNNAFESAINDYTSALQFKSDNIEAYFRRGICYYSLKKNTEALADFSIVIALAPQRSLAYYYRGLISQSSKLHESAITDFSSTLKLEPEYKDALIKRASSYFTLQKYDQAIADYDAILKIDPRYYWSFYNKGLAYSNKGEKERAIIQFSSALDIEPTYASAYEQRGSLYIDLNKNEKAIADFTEAIRLNRSNTNNFYERSRAFYANKEYKKSIEDVNTYLVSNPKSGSGYFVRGLCHAGLENNQQAFADLSKSILLDPTFENVYLNRGWLYNSEGEYTKAMADFTTALQINPKSAYGHWYMGISHFYSGNTDRAIDYCTKALTLDPQNQYILTSRAGAYVYLGKYKEAIADYEKSLSIDPLYANTYIDYFTVLLHTGDLNKAKSLYQLYKSRGVKREPSTKDWAFYEHYINALTDGIFQNSYEKALAELTLSEEKFQSNNTSDSKKNQAKFGYVDILFLKGYVNEQLGQIDKASIAYEQALVINKNQYDVKDALERVSKKTAVAIKLDKTPPTIKLISPKSTRSIEVVSDATEKEVTGTAYDLSGIKSITINGKEVKELETTDQIGYFSHLLNLEKGANVITIEAIDNNSNKATETFTLNFSKEELTKTVETPQAQVNQALDFTGTVPQYHAIIIGEQDYKPPFTRLQNPIRDARALKDVLESNYTFDAKNIVLLENKNQQEIRSAIIQKCNTLTKDDNLLIFYAGHGVTIPDRLGQEDGYWIPTSATDTSTEHYIDFADLKKQLYRSNAKHVLIVADACYAGALTDTRGLPATAPPSIQLQYESRSRKAMTSSNKQVVSDNSVFLAQLVDRLKTNKQKYLPAYMLYNGLREIVLGSGTQPIYAPIGVADDRGGEFIFIRRN
jgi:tetratricopeptide (TPR) repeat protein